MDFFMNNIPRNKSSLIGVDCPKSVKLATTLKNYKNNVVVDRIQTIEQELINSARMSVRYY